MGALIGAIVAAAVYTWLHRRRGNGSKSDENCQADIGQIPLP
jgi:hypothetical protein